ncbi:MAG: hypothetical protein CVU07_11940 [Bacteroidetes bacterium HGW-Bacteroidetes-23]|nr:MAG: hypothetical protein CVU07_11940 [Bacteroidetes bacterium HGW-Bacteroidetes-23]
MPIYADVYFNKDYFGILLYLNHTKPKVVKFSQSNDVEVCDKLVQEANALKFANKIHHKNVSTPSLLSFFSIDTITYFEQDLIFANDLHALPKATQTAIYYEVFDFMYLVYQQAGINLISPKVEEKKNMQYVEDLLMNFDEGSFIISKYKKLIKDNKFMFSGKTHGDLIFNNILFNKKNNKIWLIDWGESSNDYLAKDFISHIECAKVLFQKIIDDLNNTTSRLVKLNKNLLVLSKIESNSYTEKQQVDLYDIIHNQISFFKEQANSKDIDININCNEKVIVNANPFLVETLINNLFINTINHNINGGQINVTITSKAILFSNTGVLLPLKTEKMFERFSKSNPSSKGNGLGLSIIKKIVDANNWSIKYSFDHSLHRFEVTF